MIKRKSTNCATNIAQNPPAWRRQLDLFPHQGNRHKPQISSISAIFPKEPHRYRVTLAGQVLGDRPFHLGKYFPRFQLQVIKEAIVLILQIVKPIFRRNQNRLTLAKGGEA